MSDPIARRVDGSDLFALFGLERRFALDANDLASRYRQLAALFHPDRFVEADQANRAEAQANAVRVNDAYATLRTPRSRARHLLELSGHPLDERQPLALPFLAEQMELRELLAEAEEHADPYAAIEQIHQQIDAGLARRQQQLASLLDREGGLNGEDQAAVREVNALILEMQFYERLGEEVGRLEDRLD